jgi:transposase
MGRARRSFTPELKAHAVRLAQLGDRPLGEVARSLDLTESTLREWVRRACSEARGEPEPATALDRKELLELRRDVRRLGWGGENAHPVSTRHRG